MNSYKPFWQNHPRLRRAAGWALLCVAPALVPILVVLANWGELKSDFFACYKNFWQAATE